MIFNLPSAPPTFPPPGLPWGHALYMVPGELSLVNRRRIVRLGALKRDLRKLAEEPHKWIMLTPAERAEFLEGVRQELADNRRCGLRPGAELNEP